MSTEFIAFARSPTRGRGFRRPSAVLMAGLILGFFGIGQLPLMAGLPRQETFDTNPQWLRVGSSGTMIVTNGQALLKLWRAWPTAPNLIADSLVAFTPYWGEGNRKNWSVKLRPDRVVELRMDLVQFKQDDAFAALGAGVGDYSDEMAGYAVLLDRNEIALGKFGSVKGSSFTAYFFWEKVSNLPDKNLTVSVVFAPINANLTIQVRVLDTLQQTVLWEKNVTDTVGMDAVLPNRSVKNLLMQPEGSASPFTGMDLFPAAGLLWCNTTSGPVGPAEVILDNFQLLDYHTPHLEITSSPASVALSWLTPLQEHIMVAADQLSGPWCPCPHPPSVSGDTLCMSMPCNSSQKFFMLVPGTQISEDFSGTKPWVPYYWDSANEFLYTWKTTGGALRIRCLDSVGKGKIMVMPPGPDVLVGDFWASVDILDWGSGVNSRSVGIVARGFVDRTNFPGLSEGYIGELWVNRNGSAEPASLNIFAGSDQSVAEVPKFDFKADSGYRLVFSGVGNQLALRLFKLSDLQRPVAVTSRTASRWSGGPVGLWVGNYGKGDYDFTLDNFFVSGTKANRQRPYPEDEE